MKKNQYQNGRIAVEGDLAIVNHGGVILVGTVQSINLDALTSNAQLAYIDHAHGGSTARPSITLRQALHVDDAYAFVARQEQLADDYAVSKAQIDRKEKERGEAVLALQNADKAHEATKTALSQAKTALSQAEARIKELEPKPEVAPAKKAEAKPAEAKASKQ